MNKQPLDNQDFELIEKALGAFTSELPKDWHGVSAGVRLKSGHIETGFVLECENPILGACAEQTVIGKVLEIIKQDPIELIVAVRERDETKYKVIPPCGRCREFITDYAPQADVIIFDKESDDIFKVSATTLLPFKYQAME